jgi:hypothetical protein
MPAALLIEATQVDVVLDAARGPGSRAALGRRGSSARTRHTDLQHRRTFKDRGVALSALRTPAEAKLLLAVRRVLLLLEPRNELPRLLDRLSAFSSVSMTITRSEAGAENPRAGRGGRCPPAWPPRLGVMSLGGLWVDEKRYQLSEAGLSNHSPARARRRVFEGGDQSPVGRW